MSAKAITMSDFNASLEEATNLDEDPTSVTEDQLLLDEAWDEASDVVDSITGFCDETGERFHTALTVQTIILMLAESLYLEAGMSRDEMVRMLDFNVYDRPKTLEPTVLTRPERKELN